MDRPDCQALRTTVRPGLKGMIERSERQALTQDILVPVWEGRQRLDDARGLTERAVRCQGRRYTSRVVQDFSARVGKPTLVEIEFDSEDVTSIRAKLDGKWHRVPAATEYADLRSRHDRSAKYRRGRPSAPAGEGR